MGPCLLSEALSCLPPPAPDDPFAAFDSIAPAADASTEAATGTAAIDAPVTDGNTTQKEDPSIAVQREAVLSSMYAEAGISPGKRAVQVELRICAALNPSHTNSCISILPPTCWFRVQTSTPTTTSERKLVIHRCNKLPVVLRHWQLTCSRLMKKSGVLNKNCATRRFRPARTPCSPIGLRFGNLLASDIWPGRTLCSPMVLLRA